MRRQPLARQQRREQHDQQRPEIIQQPGFRRRRETQREEIQRVIAEQAADADDPGDQRLLQRVEGGGPEQEARERDQRRRSRTSWRRAGTPGSSRSRPSAPTAATTSGSRSVRSVWRCGESLAEFFRHGRACRQAIHVFLRRMVVKTWMPGTKREDALACPGMTTFLRPLLHATAHAMTRRHHTMYCPPLIVSVEPVMPPASSAARNTTARAISSGSPRRLTGISGRMLFSSTSFGTACTISVLM